MKRFAIIFTILLIMPIAFAETKIYSDNVVTDTDKSIEGSIFRFGYDEHSNKVFAQTPTTNLIVDNGACKSNEVFKVCINKANFSYKNVTTYQRYYELNVDIYKLTGSLTAAAKSTLTELLPNEEADFTITITNPTDLEITSIKFSQDLSPFYLREVKGCSVNGNNLEWQGSLNPKYDKTCTAKISSDKGGTYSPAGNLSYFNGYEIEKDTVDSAAITILPRQLSIVKTFDSYTEIKHPFYMNFSLQNINPKEKLEGYLTYEFPGNANILKIPSGFTKDFNIVKQNLALDGSAALNFSFYLEPSSEGKYPVLEKYRYTIKNVDDTLENSTYINPIEPKPEIELIAEYPQVKPGQRFIVLVTLKNPSRFYDLTSIKAALKVPNNEINQSLPKLAPNQSYTIISNTFIAPEYLDTKENNLINMDLVVEYSLMEIPKSINKSLALKLDRQSAQQSTTGQTQPIANRSENATVTQAAAVAQQETASNQSRQAPAPADIVKEDVSAKKFKVDFSGWKIWAILSFIFVFIVVVPSIIFSIKRKKRLQLQGPQTPQQKANLK